MQVQINSDNSIAMRTASPAPSAPHQQQRPPTFRTLPTRVDIFTGNHRTPDRTARSKSAACSEVRPKHRGSGIQKQPTSTLHFADNAAKKCIASLTTPSVVYSR